jgi:hypothetical protein
VCRDLTQPDPSLPFFSPYAATGYHREGYHKDGYEKDGYDKYGE